MRLRRCDLTSDGRVPPNIQLRWRRTRIKCALHIEPLIILFDIELARVRMMIPDVIRLLSTSHKGHRDQRQPFLRLWS